MLSFDFSEDIQLPILNDTPGCFYFQQRRKVQCFGVLDEGANMQTNYLLDEGCCLKKETNAVISMLDDYIMHRVPKDSRLIL